MPATLEKFDITKHIYSNLYSEYYRKIGLVPMRGFYSSDGEISFSVYYDTNMFLENNIAMSGSGGNNIGYDQITDDESAPLFKEYIDLGYAEFDQTTQKFTNFTNSVVVANKSNYYGVPLVYVSETDGWKPVESMPYLWRNMEPFFFENTGEYEIEIVVENNKLSEGVLYQMAKGEFTPPSSGVRWCFYDVTDGKFVDCNGRADVVFYYPYRYEYEGEYASRTFVVKAEVLKHIIIKPKHKIYVIRVDNDLESSLINQLRPAVQNPDYDSLFETLTFVSILKGELKIGGNLSSLFFPYTTQIEEYYDLPDYNDSNFPEALESSIFYPTVPLHWNFGIVKEMAASNSWIGVAFNNGEVEYIADPYRHSDIHDVGGGTPSRICLNYRNYQNLFSGLGDSLVDAIELEFPVLYDVASRNIYTQSQTHFSIILKEMFKDCVHLKHAPAEIPYIQCNVIGESQYQSMFEGCVSLNESPLIYMCNDAGKSFKDMFLGCPLKFLKFRTSKSIYFSGNEIGDLFESGGLSYARTNLTIYKPHDVTYHNQTDNFNGFCGHTGNIQIYDILSWREQYSGTYQHYKY